MGTIWFVNEGCVINHLMPTLEKIGTIGTFVAGVAAPCCFPFLSLIGGILGLSFLAPYEKYILYAMEALVVLSLAGTIVAYRGHRKFGPLVLGILSTAAVLYSLNTDMSIPILYSGLAGLIAVSVWNSIEAKRCADACKPNERTA